MKQTPFFFFLLSLLATNLFAQFPLKQFTGENGLPVNDVWNINQDARGFLWIGTLDGFCRFDGDQFKVFKNSPTDPSSIASNMRQVSFIDVDRNMWISHNSGVSVLNPLTEKFNTIFKCDQKSGKEISNTVFGDIKSNFVWSWQSGRGLICFDRKTKTKIAEYSSTEIIDFKCKKGVVDVNGNIWLALYPNSLYQFNIKTKKFIRALDNFSVASILPYGKDELILVGSNQKIVLFSISKGIERSIHASEELTIDQDPTFYFSDIIEMDSGNFLISSSSGIFSWSISDSVFHRFNFSRNRLENLVYIYSLFKDHSGNVWIGTSGFGMFMIGTNSKHFKTLQVYDETQTIVKSISSVGNFIWVGYAQGGMDIYNKTDHKLVDHVDKSNSNLPSNYIYSICPISDHAAYLKFIFTNEVGIFDLQTKKFTSLLTSFEKAMPNYLSLPDEAEFICRKKNGMVVFNRRNFLIGLDANNVATIYDSLPKVNFTSLLFDRKDQLWAGTFDGVYFKNSNCWEKIDLGTSMVVKCLLQTSSGDIWVSGEKGIFIIGNDHKVKTWYHEGNGLINEFVYGMEEDDKGNIWFSHNKGISCFVSSTNNFKNFSKSDGLQSDEFDTGAFFKSENGIIYFGGIKGVNYFNPKHITSNSAFPTTNITDIKINDREFISDTCSHFLHFISLPYDSNTISFEFVSTEFTNQQSNQYKYRLVGVDRDWVLTDKFRNVRYPDLDPGNYTFEVMSSNNDGLWELKPAVFSFAIIPPFFQTTWFYILTTFLILFILAGIVFLFFQQRLKKQKQLLEVQQKLQDERERISMDLHDNVGTQLSLISNNIQWLAHPLVEISASDKIKRLDDVATMSKEVIYTLRETIWALNKTEIELDEFSDKLKAFVQKQLTGFSTTELEFKENIDLPVILGPSEALHLFRICQEAIANVLKHSSCSILEISIDALQKGNYCITIVDNGIGFEPSTNNSEENYGLQNMKHRARAIGAIFMLTSNKNKGTIIRITKE